MQRRCQVKSYRCGSDLDHLHVQELAGFGRFPQLDQMLPRTMTIHGDAFIIGVISVINWYYLDNGLRSVTILSDIGVVVDRPIPEHGPAYRCVRYAFGDTGEIHWSVFPGPDRCIWHVTERGWELYGQMAVFVGDTAGIFRHAFVQAVIIGESLIDREGPNGLTGYVVYIVLHDDSVILRLSAHHVWLVNSVLPKGHLGRWSAEGFAFNIYVFALHYGLIQEVHNFWFDDYIYQDVGSGETGGIPCGALILARVVAIHVCDSEHTCDRIDTEAIGDRQILVSESFDPLERWWRLATSLALNVRVFAFDDIYWTQDLFDHGSYVYLRQELTKKTVNIKLAN